MNAALHSRLLLLLPFGLLAASAFFGNRNEDSGGGGIDSIISGGGPNSRQSPRQLILCFALCSLCCVLLSLPNPTLLGASATHETHKVSLLLFENTIFLFHSSKPVEKNTKLVGLLLEFKKIIAYPRKKIGFYAFDALLARLYWNFFRWSNFQAAPFVVLVMLVCNRETFPSAEGRQNGTAYTVCVRWKIGARAPHTHRKTERWKGVDGCMFLLISELYVCTGAREVLAVNGQVCHDLTHLEAVKLFKSIKTGEIVLQLCRRNKSAHRSMDIDANAC